MDLSDRIAVVTGGSSGIGLAVAERLGAEGMRIALCARTASDLESAAHRLRERGVEVLARTADVSDPESVSRFADAVRREMGPVDVLVNNAGVGAFGELDELTVDDFDRVFGTNVRGAFLCTKAFVDRETILSPREVAEVVHDAVRLSARGTVSEVEIRPVNP